MAQAKKVYTVETIALLDGTEVEVKPLPIKRLRLAQNKINKAMSGSAPEDADDDADVEVSEDEIWEAFFSVVELVMQGQSKCEKFLEPDNGRDLLEDTLDQDTLYEIVKISTGFDFLAMQKRMQALMEQTGATL